MCEYIVHATHTRLCLFKSIKRKSYYYFIFVDVLLAYTNTTKINIHNKSDFLCFLFRLLVERLLLFIRLRLVLRMRSFDRFP